MVSDLASAGGAACIGPPMAIFGSVSTVRSQTSGWAGFAPAFAYLDEVLKAGSAAHKRLGALAAGGSARIDLTDGMFAIEQVYETKARPDGFFESHRRYIDIQVVVTGTEIMEVADIGLLPVRQSYDEERDVIIYGDFPGASVLRFAAGEAAVFLPVDGHMPSLRAAANPVLVRKTVVKVPVALARP